MKHLTPEICREAQTYLWDGSSRTGSKYPFTCCTIIRASWIPTHGHATNEYEDNV